MTDASVLSRTMSGEPKASVVADDEYPVAPMDTGHAARGRILAVRDE